MRILGTLVALALVGGPALAGQQTPIRDPKVGKDVPRAPAAAEVALAKKIAGAPADPSAYIELSKLQEDRGALADAEATLLKARQTLPMNKDVALVLAGFYNRRQLFDRTMSMLHLAAQLDPANPQSHQTLATYYWDKAYRDKTLEPAQRGTYIREGLAATDLALAIDPDYVDALVYKSLLLRMRAELTTDSSEKTRTIAEADALRSRGMALLEGKRAAALDTSSPAPSPSPPPAPEAPPDGGAPIKVGGDIKPPTRTKAVAPVYPAEAAASKTQGVVVIEATINAAGVVSDARVVRSVPIFDQSALDAVRQWRYNPTFINGRAVPVIITVTVNFSLD